MSAITDTCAEVASVARLIARAGLVQAFGHVSARLDHGGFALTSTLPLIGADADDVLELDADGSVIRGDRCPIEAPLHAAIYGARPDVAAICRTHSPHAATWACGGSRLPLIHGLGGLSGSVASHDSPQLISDDALAAAAATSLGDADCLLMRGNGALCTAAELRQAAVRAWFLEERAFFAHYVAGAAPLTGDELSERSRHFEAEAARAWSWLETNFGENSS